MAWAEGWRPRRVVIIRVVALISRDRQLPERVRMVAHPRSGRRSGVVSSRASSGFFAKDPARSWRQRADLHYRIPAFQSFGVGVGLPLFLHSA